MFFSQDAINSAINGDIYSSWGLGPNTMTEIMELDWSQYVSNHHDNDDQPNIVHPDNHTKCPVCNKTLNISHPVFMALLTGEETDHAIHHQNVTKSIRRHCIRHHERLQLWMGAELNYTFGENVSLLFMAQKVIAKAAHEYEVTANILGEVVQNPASMSLINKISVIFGHALANLSVHKASKAQFGYSEEEREDFFHQAFAFVSQLMERVTSFNWNGFLRLESNTFLQLNFVKVFLRQGLFFNPPFPAFYGLRLTHFDTFKIDHHKRGEDIKSKYSICKGYECLWNANKNHTHTGGSTYGEITRSCVKNLIEAIKEHFLPLLTNQQKQFLRVLDVGGGLMTTMFHMAQVIPGFYAGIEYDPTRVRMFTESYQSLLTNNLLLIRNPKVAYFWNDLQDFHTYDFDIVYSFDQAFSFEDFAKMVQTFLNSPRAKLLISFKAAKERSENNEVNSILEFVGVTLVHSVPLRMKVSQEACTAAFYIKDNFQQPMTTNQTIDTLAREWQKCSQFWNQNTVIEALQNLKEEVSGALDETLSTRNTRKRIHANP